jgi:AmmeMemoRadiSam system protein B
LFLIVFNLSQAKGRTMQNHKKNITSACTPKEYAFQKACYKKICFFLLCLLFCFFSCHNARGRQTKMISKRNHLYAGSFYSADKQKLKSEINDFIAAAKTDARKKAEILKKTDDPALPAYPNALIVPHAGYIYSGKAAAAAYSLIKNAPFTRVILIGPHHRVSIRGFSIMPVQNYTTPLGTVLVDSLAHKWLEKGLFSSCTDQDHCLEVQLPFLQECLKNNFTIIPVLAGYCDDDDLGKAVDVISPAIDKNTLLVISTDFIHYGPRFNYMPFGNNPEIYMEKIKSTDLQAFEYIKKGDYKNLKNFFTVHDPTICGKYGLMLFSKLVKLKSSDPLLLDYYTSAQVSGDTQNTVSYLSARAFFKHED